MHDLCIFLICFCSKNHFWPKTFFFLLRWTWLPGVHCILVLFLLKNPKLMASLAWEILNMGYMFFAPDPRGSSESQWDFVWKIIVHAKCIRFCNSCPMLPKVDRDPISFSLRAGNRDFLLLKVDFFILLEKDESRK